MVNGPQVQFAFGVIHTPEQVREIIREAVAIAEEENYPPDQWGTVFEQACTLLGQRSTAAIAQQAPTFPIPRMDIPRGRG